MDIEFYKTESYRWLWKVASKNLSHYLTKSRCNSVVNSKKDLQNVNENPPRFNKQDAYVLDYFVEKLLWV